MRTCTVSVVALLSGAVPAYAADIAGTNSGAAVPGAGDTLQSGVTVTNSSALGSSAVTITSGATVGTPTVFTNSGTVQSAAGSSASGIGANGADRITIDNNETGIIESLGTGDAIRLDKNITIDNAGTIHSQNGNEAIRLGDDASVTNSGIIRNDQTPASGGNAIALRLDTSGTVLNQAGGLIEVTGSATTYSSGDQDSNIYALSVAGDGGLVTIDNYGTIRATGDSGSAETGHDEGEVGAVRLRGDDNVLNNYGTIETTGHILVSPDTNADASDDTQEIGDMYGVRIDADGATVHNYATGVITGGKHGITVDKDASNATIINELGGQITGENGSGIGSDATSGVVKVTNYGTITGTWNEDAFNGGNLAYSFGDGDGVDIDQLADIENYGTIQGTGAHGIKPGETSPSKSEGLAIGGGTIVNGDATHTAALISGADHGITVNDSLDGDAFGATDLTNYGVIRGLDGYGIKFVDVAGTWNNTITNYGTISGTDATTVMMGNGGDTFNNYGGSVTGIVDAEGGADTLDIDRADAFTLVGSDWVNFETTNIRSSVMLSGAYESATAFTVVSGASFNGSGKVTTASFLNEGTLGAGTASAVGTLTIDGDFENDAAATVAVKLDGASSDLIDITGAATLAGTLEASSLSSIDKASYTVLTADGGLNGTFGAFVDHLSPFVRASLDYVGNDVILDVDPVADSQSGSSVANALFNATGAGPELTQVLDDIGNMSADDAGKALDQLTPEQSDGPANGATQTVLAFQEQTNNRIASLQSTVAASRGGTRLALGGNTAGDLTASLVGNSVSSAAETGLWGRGFGLTGDLDAQSGQANGMSYNGGGFQGGFDSFVGEETLVGVSAGYARILNNPDRADASSDVTSYSLGLYAATLMGAVDLSGQLGYTRNDYHASRRIVILPATDEIAAADFDGDTISANAEAGYTLTYGDVVVRPAAGLDWVRLKSDGYTETGAPGLNLTQASRSDNLVRSTVGASAALTGGPVVPSLGLRWGHDIEQPDGALSYAFAGLANSTFLIDRNMPDKDALLIDAGLDAKLGKGIDFSLAGSADLRNNAQAYGLSAKLSYSW
ncbi:MAG: autotransporter domain-containing protein [Parvibaculum sp.]|nr:autotransporter domain-containing protein [Parvibaculum sp.]